MAWHEPLSRPVARHVRDEGLPGPMYAAIGLAATVREQGQALADSLASSRGVLSGLVVTQPDPSAVAGNGSQEMPAGGRALLPHALTAEALTAARSWIVGSYQQLSARGEDELVSQVAERAVRQRVGVIEDRVAPRAARAAVRYHNRKQQFLASPTGQRTTVAAARTRVWWQRSAARFSELNQPVLLDDADTPD